MFCPQCKQVMKVVEEEAFSALLCESCGGMFYPEEEFNKHLEVVRVVLPTRRSPQEQVSGKPAWALSVGEKRLPCPACGAPFGPFNYAYRSNIILAKCPACRGLWVEPGQMLRIARYRALNPGADHLVAGIVKKREKRREPVGDDKDFDRQLPRINPLGCFTILPVPVSNAPQLSRYPIVTWLLVVMNVLLYAFVGPTRSAELWGVVPADVTQGHALHTYVTHLFAHGGLRHLIGNIIFLLAFADRVEDRLGPIGFLVSYLVLGVVAGLAHTYIMPPDSEIPLVGASGAISGIQGLYLVFFPRSSIRVALLFTTIPIPALVFMAAWFAYQLMIPVTSHVAVAAHLGGFFAGAWVGGLVRILRLGEPKKAM